MFLSDAGMEQALQVLHLVTGLSETELIASTKQHRLYGKQQNSGAEYLLHFKYTYSVMPKFGLDVCLIYRSLFGEEWLMVESQVTAKNGYIFHAVLEENSNKYLIVEIKGILPVIFIK